jgi:hypothetical protein
MEYSIIQARGVLGVGAEHQDGTLSSLYRMEAVKVIEEK